MPLPALERNGYLPPGIHAASLAEVLRRFGSGSDVRVRQAELLRLIVEAARQYETIKRILLWGSFVTDKPVPNDLDYTLVTAAGHSLGAIAPEHRRFLVPREARHFYGADVAYVSLPDYPVQYYAERLHFCCETREGQQRGIVELNLQPSCVEVDE